MTGLVDVIYDDLSKVFQTVSNSILPAKLKRLQDEWKPQAVALARSQLAAESSFAGGDPGPGRH